MDPLPPMNKIFSMVLQHERQRKFSPLEYSKSLVNATDFKNFKGKPYGFGSFGKSNNHVCIHCGKTNHTIDNFYAKH